MNLKIKLIFLTLALIQSACCNQDSDKNKGSKSLVDSQAERKVQAMKVIANYPMDEWEGEIVTRISQVAGREVSSEVRERAKKKLSDAVVLEKRLTLLTENYNANDLARLADLCSTAEGKDFVKKTTNVDVKLRQLVEPLVMEVLSNSPQK